MSLIMKYHSTLIFLLAFWRCPIFLISQQIDGVHQITFFHGYFFKIGKKKTGNWRFSKLKCKKSVIGVRVIGVSVPILTMKKRVFGVHHLFVVKLEKLDNAK